MKIAYIICYVVDNDDGLSICVVSRRDCTKSLLTSCIPLHQQHNIYLKGLHHFSYEVLWLVTCRSRHGCVVAMERYIRKRYKYAITVSLLIYIHIHMQSHTTMKRSQQSENTTANSLHNLPSKVFSSGPTPFKLLCLKLMTSFFFLRNQPTPSTHIA